jgi:hypothetical protein
MGPGSGERVVSISRAGVFNSRTRTSLLGFGQVATYNVTGITTTWSGLMPNGPWSTERSDLTLTLVVDSTNRSHDANSGDRVHFSIGGSITLNASTAGGTYAGTFNVTINY